MIKKITACLLCTASFLAPLTHCGTAHAYTPPVPERYTWRENWTLYPKDADLRLARNISLHTQTQPHYLQEWENGAAVLFPIHISEAGTYSISITYSRQSVMQKSFTVGVFVLESPTMHSLLNASTHFYAELPITKDWTDFTQKNIGTLSLPQGSVYLLFTNKDHAPHEYIMNLQQVHIKKQ